MRYRVTDHLCCRHIHEIICLSHLLLLYLHHIEITLISLSWCRLNNYVSIPVLRHEMLVYGVNALFLLAIRIGNDLVLVVWDYTVQTFLWLDVFKFFLNVLLMNLIILFNHYGILRLFLIIFKDILIILLILINLVICI